MKYINNVKTFIFIFFAIFTMQPIANSMTVSSSLFSLRVPLISSDAQKTKSISELHIEHLVREIESRRQTQIEVEVGGKSKLFAITQYEQACQWIIQNDPEIRSIVDKHYKGQKYLVSWLLFYVYKSEDVPNVTEELRFIYTHNSIKQLRQKVVQMVLTEWKLKYLILREKGFFKDKIAIDIAEGSNPCLLIAADFVIGINDIVYKDLMDIFVERHGDILGLTKQKVNSRLSYKRADVRLCIQVWRAIDEAKSRNLELKGKSKVWFFNSVPSKVASNRIEYRIADMNSLIEAGDIVIVSDFQARTEISEEFLRDMGYEIDNSLSDLSHIFDTGIDKPFLVSTLSKEQFIYPLRHIVVLRKRVKQRYSREPLDSIRENGTNI